MPLNQFPFLPCLSDRIVGESNGIVFQFVGCKGPKKNHVSLCETPQIPHPYAFIICKNDFTSRKHGYIT